MQQFPTKIRFVQTCSTERECFVRGRERDDLPPELAASFIRAGFAVAVEETPPPPAPTPAVTPPAVPRSNKQRGAT